MTIKELDIVALTHAIPEHNLEKGDLGTVIHCYKKAQFQKDEAFEVEFVNSAGKTMAQLTLKATDIRISKRPTSQKRQ